jgi:hypothetical protein
MKKLNTLLAMVLVVVASSLTSCEAIGGVFKAGMGFGIFAVLAVLVIIVFGIMKMRNK